MAGWDSNSFLLDLSRFGVLDIRPRPGVEVKLPPGADLDKIFVAQQRQIEEYPFEPRMLMRMLQAAPERLKIHLCLSTVRFKRELRVEGPRETHMSIQYHLRLQCAVREFLRLYVNTSAEAVRWVPPDERKRRRCNPFEAVPTLEELAETARSKASPPVLHVFQCMVDWPAILGVRDKPVALRMSREPSKSPEGHAMLVLVMSDLSGAYYFDPAGHSCLGSRFWRHRWEQALGTRLQDLVRTREQVWGPQILPALLRQPGRVLNITSQWCCAWCTMVTGLLVWNCCEDAASAEHIGEYLYAKRAKRQSESIAEQAKYMDQKIRHFVLYMAEMQLVPLLATVNACDRVKERQRPQSIYPEESVTANMDDDNQFWRKLNSRNSDFSPVLQDYAVDPGDPPDVSSAPPGPALDHRPVASKNTAATEPVSVFDRV